MESLTSRLGASVAHRGEREGLLRWAAGWAARPKGQNKGGGLFFPFLLWALKSLFKMFFFKFKFEYKQNQTIQNTYAPV